MIKEYQEAIAKIERAAALGEETVCMGGRLEDEVIRRLRRNGFKVYSKWIGPYGSSYYVQIRSRVWWIRLWELIKEGR